MVSERIQSAAKAKLIRTWERLRGQYPAIQTRYPHIVYDGRLKTTAGLAYGFEGYIRLSKYLMAEFPEKMINVIIPHELAHIVAMQIHGEEGMGHGTPWIKIMEFLGQPAHEYHDMISHRHANEVFMRRVNK